MDRRKKLVLGLIALGVLLLVLGGMYFFTQKEREEKGAREERVDITISDAVRFSEEYEEVPEDNIFVYRDIDEIQKILENGTGIVYLGFPECPWCQRYVKYLYDVAKEKGVEKIYYFNILEDRRENTEGYQKIVALLGDYLGFDDEGNHRVYVPDITFMNEGRIVARDNETSMSSGDVDEYWTSEKIQSLKNRLRIYIEDMDNSVCVTCD